MNKIRIEVANNLPFAKFYIACIQTHYVHKYVTWEACRHFKNEESRNPVYFGLAPVQWGLTDENVLPTLLKMTL